MKRRSLDGSGAWDIASGSDFKAGDMAPRQRPGKSCNEITSRGFLLIRGMPGHLLYRFASQRGHANGWSGAALRYRAMSIISNRAPVMMRVGGRDKIGPREFLPPPADPQSVATRIGCFSVGRLPETNSVGALWSTPKKKKRGLEGGGCVSKSFSTLFDCCELKKKRR